jgi:hypothetical protein
MANRETQLRRIIEELFELASPGYLKTSLWKAYQVILSESGQKATRAEMNKGILEPIDPHIQQVLTDIARTYQEDRERAKGYENTERAICEALFPIVIPGSVKNSLRTVYQATEGEQEGSTTLTNQVDALQQALEQQRKYEQENWPFVGEHNEPTGTGESITYHLASLYCWSPEYVLSLEPEARLERLNEIWRTFSIAGDIIKRYEDATIALLKEEESEASRSGECVECGRFSSLLSANGYCEGCVMQAAIDAMQENEY